MWSRFGVATVEEWGVARCRLLYRGVLFDRLAIHNAERLHHAFGQA